MPASCRPRAALRRAQEALPPRGRGIGGQDTRAGGKAVACVLPTLPRHRLGRQAVGGEVRLCGWLKEEKENTPCLTAPRLTPPHSHSPYVHPRCVPRALPGEVTSHPIHTHFLGTPVASQSTVLLEECKDPGLQRLCPNPRRPGDWAELRVRTKGWFQLRRAPSSRGSSATAPQLP